MSDPSEDPLPPGWSRAYSKSNQKYYFFHKETKTTQWHFPTAREAKDPNLVKKRAKEFLEKEEAKRAKISDIDLADATSVAIIVPFRDLHVEQKRLQHLKRFVPHMVGFLSKGKTQKLLTDFKIYIITQSDDGRKFNRGKLLNIGFDIAKRNGHDVFVFHDVDLLPSDDLISWYAQFPKVPIHIARVWDRYSGNEKYFGGVCSFSSSDFKRINGYPNNYFGWGGEDDELQRRLERLRIKFDSPDKGRLQDLEEMDIQTKMDFLRSHKTWKCMVKWELKDEHEKTWKTNGLHDLNYKKLEEKSLHEKATQITVDVKLNGNHWTNEKAGIDYLPPK